MGLLKKGKKKIGRPDKTLSDLPKDWKSILLKLKKEGASDVEVRVALNISQELWERFKKEIEQFSITVKKGQDLCEAWWVKHGRKQLENRKFNMVLWYMNMKNRFGWRDKTETDITSGGKPIPLLQDVRGNDGNKKSNSPRKKN